MFCSCVVRISTVKTVTCSVTMVMETIEVNWKGSSDVETTGEIGSCWWQTLSWYSSSVVWCSLFWWWWHSRGLSGLKHYGGSCTGRDQRGDPRAVSDIRGNGSWRIFSWLFQQVPQGKGRRNAPCWEAGGAEGDSSDTSHSEGWQT